METYFETLRDYILAQQPDLGDGETVLEMIYECYSQLNCMDNETIRKDFDELYRAMHGQPLRGDRQGNLHRLYPLPGS